MMKSLIAITKLLLSIALSAFWVNQPARAQEPAPSSVDVQLPSAQTANSKHSYLMFTGDTMNNRKTANQMNYVGDGCVNPVFTDNVTLTVPIHLPQGSVIKQLRLYFNDTTDAAMINTTLLKIKPGENSVNLATVDSGTLFKGGFGINNSPELSETVDNEMNAYVVNGIFSVSGAQTQLCGIRVGYYAPPIWAAFAPAILRQTP